MASLSSAISLSILSIVAAAAAAVASLDAALLISLLSCCAAAAEFDSSSLTYRVDNERRRSEYCFALEHNNWKCDSYTIQYIR